MPYHRRLQLCFALLALSTAGCSGAPRSSPILTGTLVVTVKPADGITPTVIITGPNAYSKTITSTQTIGNLPIGDYNITADSVAHPDSIVGTVVDTAFVSGNPVSLQTGDTAKVTVTYATERRTGGLWIANNAYGTIPDYASAQLRAGGALVAAETLATAAGGPAGIALDPQSNLWVSDFTSDSVFMYSRAAIDGDSSTPSKVIVDSIIQSANNIAFDPQGDLWVADGDGFLFEYTPTQLAAGGKQNAVLQISGPELGVPYALTFDPYGNLWVADQGYNHIVEYSESQLGGTGPSCTPPPAVQCAPTPVDTIGANANSINTPSGLAFDSKGDLWVANSSGGTIVEFTPAQITSNGGPTPQVTITAPTGAVLNGLAIDNSSSVWVTSAPGGLSGAIYAFTAAQLATSGSPAPSVTITGTLKFFTPAQLLFDPGSIAEAPSAAVVRNAHLHASTVGRLNPSLARALHRREAAWVSSADAPLASTPRSVLLADCDVYYVQLARLADPDGAGRASLLIVGGTADSRGVVCSASYEVREFGVRSGMPIARALRLCPAAMCVPIPRRLCTQKSREVVRVLQRFAPAVQSASPDEAYLELTSAMSTIYRGRTLDSIAHDIRRAVKDETAIRISLGGGTNRLVAKLAVERAKPRPGTGGRGVHIVAPGDEAAFVSTFALADIPGIGPKFQQRLARIGWRDVVDVLPHDRATLERVAGKRQGGWLFDVARGIDGGAVQARSPRKSIGHETTFRHDVIDDDALLRTLLALTDSAASDLRAGGCAARTIAVRLKDADFVLRRASRTVSAPLTTYQAISPIVTDLLRRLRSERRVAARLVGVTLSQLMGDDGADQLALFDTAPSRGDTPKQRRVAAAVDHLRRRLGHDIIGFGTGKEKTDS